MDQLTTLYPLLTVLVSRTAGDCYCAQKGKDLLLLSHALTRFMDNEKLEFSFKNDNDELRGVICKYVGDTYMNRPLPLSALADAMGRIIAELDYPLLQRA